MYKTSAKSDASADCEGIDEELLISAARSAAMAQRRSHEMSTTYYVKTLRLAPPEVAHALDIPASEAPVFLSPIIDTLRHCACRGQPYTPLRYAPGQITRAANFHSADGGIYTFVITDLKFLDSLDAYTGWVALVEPLGQIRFGTISGDACARVEAVRTLRIMAYCLDRATSPRTTHTGGATALAEGILLVCPSHPRQRRVNSDKHPGDLLPLCGPHELLDGEQAPLRFKFLDGQVYFSTA
jgi:hypothetical protein